jgi:hypothetical protein
MDGSNETLIQQFSKKLEGMSDLRITFNQFGFCYAAYSVFSPQYILINFCEMNLVQESNLLHNAPCEHVCGFIAELV